jgi:uncharacterized protein YdaU (DUF1376 family)
MAKELPYFKFEPSEWDNGIIQMCSRESKGLFIDICAMYWSRLGNLPYKLVVQKLCNGNANALHELMQEQVFSIADEQIVIKFLDNQLSEFGHKSNQASKAAKARWSKHNKNKGKNADAMQTHSERNAIREDKIRLDKIKEDNTNANKLAEGVVEYFNGVCVNLPKVVKLTDKRKKHILARLKEHSKEDIKKVIDLTAESNFLNGKNTNGWTASFDWIIDKSNFIKILENNYINKQNGKDRRQISVKDFNESIERHFR